jgi:hypothetical protein
MFDKIAVGIKTFLRDEKLFNVINAVDRYMPEAQMIIADCGEGSEAKTVIYHGMEAYGHKIIRLPFDAGFGAMSNAIATELKRNYLLIASDDFDFDAKAAQGVHSLYRALQFDLDIASGRVNNNPYEFFLEEFAPGRIREVRAEMPGKFLFHKVDLTVNYSLIRKEALEKVRWDNEARIGEGEHGAFFYDAKKAGFNVVYVPGVNINEQLGQDSERYKQFRKRALSPSRICFEKRGIVEWVLGNGVVDYDARPKKE